MSCLRPSGNSPGTLHIGGNLDLQSGRAFQFELGPTPATSDLLAVSGFLNLIGGGTIVFVIVDAVMVPGLYDLITFSGSTGVSLANLQFGIVPVGFAGSFVLDADSVSLQVSAIP